MSTPTRDEFDARIEAIETRIDARVAAICARLDASTARAEEREQRFLIMFAERDKRLDERDKRLDERDNRLDERDKRLELHVQQAIAAAQSASNLKSHMWLAASTVIVAVVGTVVAAYYATQSSHLDIAQTVISAFQQGQQMQIPPLKQ